jgi:hypothetical protein
LKVNIKDFAVSMQLGNKGIELNVSDNSGKHLGDLIIGKARLEWCPGRTPAGRGIRKSWEQVIAYFTEK